MKLIRQVAPGLAFVCAACATSDKIYGDYAASDGATLKFERGHYVFCKSTCSSGRADVRSLDSSSGRVTFYGRQISEYFRDAKTRYGPAAAIPSWSEGAETSYEMGTLQGVKIYIDPGSDSYFNKRR